MKNQWRKKDKQDFHLNDGKDSIRITLWGKDTKQLRGTSDGDFVRVTNVKTSHYYETVSLNSTDFTRIFKVAAANMLHTVLLMLMSVWDILVFLSRHKQVVKELFVAQFVG